MCDKGLIMGRHQQTCQISEKTPTHAIILEKQPHTNVFTMHLLLVQIRNILLIDPQQIS